ncbi:hypothetical protein H0H92_004261 [Tricholoma furcatifolium]|nr:hypothetical protein H0H92_004261 [Tricholoma furcatifolium]
MSEAVFAGATIGPKGVQPDLAKLTAIVNWKTPKNFGSTHINALLDPITRRHPFELIVGDYLSLLKGAGGYKTAGLYLDTYSQHLRQRKDYRGCSPQDLDGVCAMEVFMSDGGSHFNNTTVRDFCVSQGTKAHIVSAYSPWINGLVEGTNKLLLHVLKRMCAPDLNEDEYDAIDWESLPANWPNHFDNAITVLNRRLLPALKFTPKELLLGLVVNIRLTPVELSSQPVTPEDALVQMAYVEQQRLDGYSEAVAHAVRRKTAFNRKVLGKGPGEVIFLSGDLVQVYRNDLDYTFKSDRKLLPKWSRPHRVVAREVNSYTLETCDGVPIEGQFSVRWLRRFEPKEGTKLAEAQREIEGQRRREEDRHRREARGWGAAQGGP